jgi:hypothetical protein
MLKPKHTQVTSRAEKQQRERYYSQSQNVVILDTFSQTMRRGKNLRR